MADPNNLTPVTVTVSDSDITIHTVPLPGEAKVLVLVEAAAHVTHVISLDADAARGLVLGLLDALDIAEP
jgi:hypothetical protein